MNTWRDREDERAILVAGSIRHAEIRVEQVSVLRGAPPKYAYQPGGIDVRILDKNGDVLRSFDIADPRIVETIEGPAEVYVAENARFELVLPYVAGATTVEIVPGENFWDQAGTGTQPDLSTTGQEDLAPRSVQIDLRDAFRLFCVHASDNRECRRSLGLAD